MKKESGQSLVEFALVLPVLVLLIFGIIDFGRVLHTYLTLDHAGREAARAASIGKTDADVKSVADANAAGLTASKLTVSISPSGTKKTGDSVEITLTYPIDFLTPVVGEVVGSFYLKDKTVMRVE
ncbi:TadE/TadG family type IV pilus assembly protein [Ectobacillus ponti]|uniref:Pilus assembly protein n=1 Tax=Ectobacillus ponti TaxID=2961894 RepID=A0AA41X601_9BACI|nr:TadE family protein [Ectobacillus ponti]MCP8969322.1 pilus assembly protein [Ectobacillus ponti]